MKTLYIPIFALSFSSHAGLMDYARGKLCNENGAYAQGMNDARGDKPMSLSFSEICEQKVRDVVQKSYREGYTNGLQSQERPKAEININVASTGKRVYCELHPFTESYSAWGSSQLEAQVNVKAKCLKKNDEMFCKDFDCHDAE